MMVAICVVASATEEITASSLSDAARARAGVDPVASSRSPIPREPRLGCLFSFFLSADGKRWPAGARSRSHLSPLGVRSLLRVTHGFDGTNSIEQQRRRQTRRCPLRCNLLALMAGDEEALRCDRAEPRCRAHETPPKELEANAGGNVGNVGVLLGPHCRQQYGGTTRTQAVAYDTG